MADWTKQLAQAPTKPTGAPGTDWAAQLGKPRTFDQALAARDAATTVSVDVPRLQAAQGLAEDYPDPRNPEDNPRGDTSVGIEPFMRTNAPPILPAKQANFVASLKAGLLSDPQAKRREIAKSIFPDDPNGHTRAGEIDGKPVYVDDNGDLRWVSRGGSRFLAGIAANSPEMILGGIGSFAGSPVVGGALGATGARGIKRGMAGLLMDEPQTIGGNLRELGGEAAGNLVAGGIGKGIAAVAGRGKVVDFTPSEVSTATQAREYIKRTTGIDTDLAQASGNRKLIALRVYAARFPGKSAELVQAAEELQQGQLDEAVTRVLDNVAKSAPSEVFGAAGINAAGLTIELAKGARDKAVAPFYEAARKVSISGDVAEMFNKDPVLRHFGRKVQNDPLYQRDLGIGGKPPASSNPNSLGYWHQVQQAIDDEIAKNAKEPNRVRILTQARKDLNRELEAASPEFKLANEHYAQVTRDTIEPLEASAVGVLSRITSPKAATAAARVLSDPNISAAEIRATLVSLNKINPEIGPGLVRQWISQQWNRALKETQAGAEVNAAGKLRQAIYGTPEAKVKADAMMPPGAKQAFEDLMTATQALARTHIAGSNTARDLNIEGQLKGQGGVILKWLTSPRATAKDALEQRAVEKNTLALAEALLDPAKQHQLKIIVRMPESTKKAIALAALLSGQSMRAAAHGDDQMPLSPTRAPQQMGSQR